MTVEKRRTAILHAIRKEIPTAEQRVALAICEELFSIADSWHVMATALEEMARTQKDQLELHKRMMGLQAVVMKGEK